MEKIGAKHRSLDNMIYERLKALIIERKLMPGEKIYQDKVADELGVSRTPLVNALKMLEREKLISAVPRKGFYVRLFSKQEMVHIFELREVLEGLVARRAATHITDAQIEKLQKFFTGFTEPEDFANLGKYREEDRRFHNFILDVGGEDILSSILETYNIITFAYQFLEQEGLVRPPAETIQEHRVIIEAITARDPLKAEELAHLHLKKSIEKIKKEIEEEKQGESASPR
ncbi:MAG: FCD domain-containing protein [Desulfobacterales bacterium]|nr:FCD domain-containing protein [Desulfobacterales bacterium]